MAQCPDCDNILIRLTENLGNGRCSSCHGSGIDAAAKAFNILSDDHSCYVCSGTGQCQKERSATSRSTASAPICVRGSVMAVPTISAPGPHLGECTRSTVVRLLFRAPAQRWALLRGHHSRPQPFDCRAPRHHLLRHTANCCLDFGASVFYFKNRGLCVAVQEARASDARFRSSAGASGMWTTAV